MPAAPPVYCIDTSSILVWFVDTYPPTIFPGLLARMEALIDAGRLRAPRAVLDEIRPGDDCHKWCRERSALFLEGRFPPSESSAGSWPHITIRPGRQREFPVPILL